jgi:hypothetical protein
MVPKYASKVSRHSVIYYSACQQNLMNYHAYLVESLSSLNYLDGISHYGNALFYCTVIINSNKIDLSSSSEVVVEIAVC